MLQSSGCQSVRKKRSLIRVGAQGLVGMLDFKLPLNRHAAALKQIADELNLPVEAFLDEPLGSEAADILALVRFWSAIHDGQGRRRVLSVARQEAERAASALQPKPDA